MYDLSLDSVILDSQPTLNTNDSIAELLLIDPNQDQVYDGLRVSLNGTYHDPIDTVNSELSNQITNVDSISCLNFLGTSRSINHKKSGLLYHLVNGRLGGYMPLIFRHDIEIRFVPEGRGIATLYPSIIDLIFQLDDSLTHVPFEIWDIEYENGDGTIGRQINAIFIDDANTSDSLNGFLGSLNGLRDIIIPVYSQYDGSHHSSNDTMASWLIYFGQNDNIENENNIHCKYAGYSVGDRIRFSFVNHIVPEEDTIRFISHSFPVNVENEFTNTESSYKLLAN